MKEDVIRELYKNQRHFSSSIPFGSIGVSNISCGDEVSLNIEIDASDVVTKVSFFGSACSLTLASAEYLCREIEGKSFSGINATDLQQRCLLAFGMLERERRVLCVLLPYRALVELKQKLGNI